MSGDLDPQAVVAIKWAVAMAAGWVVMTLGRRGVAVNTSVMGSATARTAQVVGTFVFWAAMIGLAGWLLWLLLARADLRT